MSDEKTTNYGCSEEDIIVPLWFAGWLFTISYGWPKLFNDEDNWFIELVGTVVGWPAFLGVLLRGGSMPWW